MSQISQEEQEFCNLLDDFDPWATYSDDHKVWQKYVAKKAQINDALDAFPEFLNLLKFHLEAKGFSP